MNFYKHYIGDFQRDTRRLTILERGAYRDLLDELYATESPLSLNHSDLYRITGCETKMDRAAVDKVIGMYFEKTLDGYVQGRAVEEIKKARAQAETNRRIAADREAKKVRTNRVPFVRRTANGDDTK